MSGLKGKVAIITGAGAGIGRATAIHFASLGCYLSLNDLNASSLEETRSKCLQSSLSVDQILLVPGDVGDGEDASNLVSSTVGRFGKLDVLVNNAGIYIASLVDNNEVADLEKMMRVNFVAVFRLINLAIPHLKASRGCVVNVASVAGFKPIRSCMAYGSTKAAVLMLTKNVALETLEYGIRVNAVCPGAVKTNIARATLNSRGQSNDEVMADRPLHAEIAKLADPSEIAKPIAFLCSDDASAITGSALDVDYGFGLKNYN